MTTTMADMRRIDLERGDLETGGDLDDLAISGEHIKLLRIERMSDHSAWGRIYMNDGRDVVLRFGVGKGKLVMTAEGEGG
jgi:hypothetical protein